MIMIRFLKLDKELGFENQDSPADPKAKSNAQRRAVNRSFACILSRREL
jgi:hypothetical protein